MSSEPITDAAPPRVTPPPLRLASLLIPLAGSFALFTGSFVIDQAVRWTDTLDGIRNGLVQTIVTGLFWMVFGLLPGLLIYSLFQWRGWQRFRTIAILSPAIVIAVLVMVNLITSPPTPAHRLKSFTGAELPASAREIRTYFSGGGLRDYTDIYSFRCTAAETDALIRALYVSPVETEVEFSALHLPPSFPSWPDRSTWSGGTYYHGESHLHGGRWSYTLQTDAAREQIYLWIHSM
jgi:hypothetical protein